VKCGFFIYIFFQLSKLILGQETQVLNGKLCKNDEFGVRMDLGRSNIIYFAVFKKKIRQYFIFSRNFYKNGC
jgi:hypothetical protein